MKIILDEEATAAFETFKSNIAKVADLMNDMMEQEDPPCCEFKKYGGRPIDEDELSDIAKDLTSIVDYLINVVDPTIEVIYGDTNS